MINRNTRKKKPKKLMKIKGGREDLVAYVCKKTSQIIAGTDHSLTHKQSL